MNFCPTISKTKEAIRQEHYGARHHCYAYRIGKGGARFRANDDGEPSETAGKPILGQLLSAGLTNVLIVVTRYFGGTLLGTSGLIAAYRSAAAAAVANARVLQRTWDVELSAKFPYARLNEVMRLVKEEQLRVLSQDFGSEQGAARAGAPWRERSAVNSANLSHYSCCALFAKNTFTEIFLHAEKIFLPLQLNT